MSRKFETLFTHDAEPISDADLVTVTRALMPHLLDRHDAEFDARALLISKLISRVHLEKNKAPRGLTATEQHLMPWKCFHCGEVFTSKVEAAMHFGLKDFDTPGCKLNEAQGGLLGIVREQARELERYREEDTQLMRQLYAAGGDREIARREGEEKGYVRGLGDHAAVMRDIASKVVRPHTILGESSGVTCVLCGAASWLARDLAHTSNCPVKGYS